jgi:hypothetical protein
MRNPTARPLALCLAALSLLASGCATILSGPNQKVEVFTAPPGATVTAGSQQILSPGKLKLPRKEGTEVRIELAGYETRTVWLARKENGLVWIDLIGVAAGILAGAAVSGDTFSESVTISTEAAVAVGALAGTAGFVADYRTGAAFKLDPPRIVVTLLPAAP